MIKYFIATDLHLYHKMNARYDYFKECESVVEDILKTLEENKSTTGDNILILAGDVVHQKLTYSKDFTRVNDLISRLIEPFDKTYLNIGNHEITYQANNPILKRIKNINHPKIDKIRKSFLGEKEDVCVVDRISYDNVNIDFYPYGAEQIVKEPNKITIAIGHGSYINDNLSNYLREEGFHVPKRTALIENPDFLFTGHEHTVIANHKNGNTNIYNLGSLMRTNVREVRDNDRKRIIPVIEIENDNLVDIKYPSIYLPLRSSVINEEKVIKDREKYKKQKERKIKINRHLNLSNNLDDSLIKVRDFLYDKYGESGSAIYDGIIKKEETK